MQRVPIIIPERATANDLGGAELIKKHHLGRVYRGRQDLLDSFGEIVRRHQDHVDDIARYVAAFPADFDTQRETIASIVYGRR